MQHAGRQHPFPTLRLASIRLNHDRLWAVCCIAAAVLILAAASQPLWEMTLHAPQYPQGLSMTAYGTRLDGDLGEVNALNHYVGVARIDPDEMAELALFPYAIAGLVVVVIVAAVIDLPRWMRLLVGLSVWGFAIGFLIDVQWWLYRAGHNLEHDAPMRIDEFTPKVIGGTQVVNFHSETMPAIGFWMIVAAALLVSVVPPVVRFFIASWRNTGDGVTPQPVPGAR